jgi:hypothetical protein
VRVLARREAPSVLDFRGFVCVGDGWGFVLGDYLPEGLAGWLADSFDGLPVLPVLPALWVLDLMFLFSCWYFRSRGFLARSFEGIKKAGLGVCFSFR